MSGPQGTSTHRVEKLFYDQLDWEEWWAEEEARREDKRRRETEPRSRYIKLSDELVGRLDRIARVQGIDRHEMLAIALDFYFASWRLRP